MAFVEEPLATEPGSPPEGAPPGNRAFYIAVGILGGLFVIGLLCIGAYAFFIQPGRRAAQQAQQAIALTQNAEVALALTQQAAATDTPPPTATTVPATATPVIAATDTATVPPTNTPAATDTNTPAAVAQVTGTSAGGVTLAAPTAGGPTATPLRGASATPTPLVGGLRTPTPTQLPGTGFADEAGVPQLVLLGIALIAVVIVARRLRLGLR